MNRSKNVLLTALIAGTLASASFATFAQTTSDPSQMSSADKKAAKKQAAADKDAAVAQAKADKKKTESQSEANEAAADAKVKNAKKAE